MKKKYKNGMIRFMNNAVDLYTKQDMSWGEAKQELINQGLNIEDATIVVSNLKEQEREAKKRCFE